MSKSEVPVAPTRCTDLGLEKVWRGWQGAPCSVVYKSISCASLEQRNQHFRHRKYAPNIVAPLKLDLIRHSRKREISDMEALTLSRINASLASARQLSAQCNDSNNERPRGNSSSASEAGRRLELQRVSSTVGGLRLFAVAHYGGDPAKYDTTQVLVFYAERNTRVATALENTLFENHERGLSQRLLLETFQRAIPSIPHIFPTATRITLRTRAEGEEPVYTFSEETEEVVAYPSVPPSLANVTTVQIGELSKISPARFGTHVDRVSWHGREYAFKQCTRDVEDMLLELDILVQQPSPRVLQMSAIVIDSQQRLRGFLAPFMPYGSLEEVFTNVSQPNMQEMHALGNVAYPEHPTWTTKLKWSKQIVRGIADLHGSPLGPIALGNFNPRNVLIDDNGDALIIGLSGMARGTRYPARWAAPERMRGSYTVGPPLDVANMGMVLWALAEEEFTRFTSSASSVNGAGEARRSGRWRRPDTPHWFRMMVDRCVQDEPTQRPTATEVLDILDNEAVA